MKKKILFTLGSCFMLALAGCNNSNKDVGVEKKPDSDETKNNVLPVESECEHNWKEDNTYEGNVKPTCVTPGVQGYKCSRCNETNVVDVEALGHNWNVFGDCSEPNDGDSKFDYWYCENEGCGRQITAIKARYVSLNCKKEPRTIEGHDKNGNVVTYSEADYIENSD